MHIYIHVSIDISVLHCACVLVTCLRLQILPFPCRHNPPDGNTSLENVLSLGCAVFQNPTIMDPNGQILDYEKSASYVFTSNSLRFADIYLDVETHLCIHHVIHLKICIYEYLFMYVYSKHTCAYKCRYVYIQYVYTYEYIHSEHPCQRVYPV